MLFRLKQQKLIANQDYIIFFRDYHNQLEEIRKTISNGLHYYGLEFPTTSMMMTLKAIEETHKSRIEFLNKQIIKTKERVEKMNNMMEAMKL